MSETPNLTVASKSVAQRAGLALSIDWNQILSVVTTLLPMLVQCSALLYPNQSVKSVAESHYDEQTGKYDGWLISRSRAASRRAAKKEGQRHLTKSELDQISIAAFDEAREGDAVTVGRVVLEAQAVKIED